MADNMSYSPTSPYIPHQYYPNTNLPNSLHIVPPPSRPDLAQRKRPKYTRSKTGCLTCRVKKIKCDETKPNCMRCTHGSRECSWPEGVPVRKKSIARREDDARPSTAGSSGVSEASTPPERDHSPSRRNEVDLSLMPLPSRAPSGEGFMHMHAMNPDHESSRRPLDRGSGYSQSHTSPTTVPNMLSMIPESYTSRYDHAYLNGTNPSHSPRQGMPPYRSLTHPSGNHWNHPPDAMDSYYGHHGGLQERVMVGHGSPNDHSHTRYQ